MDENLLKSPRSRANTASFSGEKFLAEMKAPKGGKWFKCVVFTSVLCMIYGVTVLAL